MICSRTRADELYHCVPGRLSVARFGKLYLASIYAQNCGQRLEKMQLKKAWWSLLVSVANKIPNLVIAGDFNAIVDRHRDIYDPKIVDRPGASPEEVRAMNDLIKRFSLIDPHSNCLKFTYWDYRSGARVHNRGWRLDYILVPKSLETSSPTIEDSVHGSDHCPVTLKLAGKDPPITFEFPLVKDWKTSSLPSPTEYCISRKYDGVRLFFDLNSRKTFTRKLNVVPFEFVAPFWLFFDHMSKWTNDLKGAVLDCELVSTDFKSCISAFKAKRFNGSLRLMLFDAHWPQIPVFSETVKRMKTAIEKAKSIRNRELDQFLASKGTKLNDLVFCVNQNESTTLEQARDLGWEGFVVRLKGQRTRNGRTNDLRKIKFVFSEEFKIIDTKLDQASKELRSIRVKKGKIESWVGSGFSTLARKHLFTKKIIGKTVTIDFMGKTAKSLRHPVFVAFRNYE